MTSGFDVTFHGVRGSTPCHGPSILRYGGNTSCVSVAVPGHDPVMFDLGTGARYFGAGWPTDRAFRATCLLSHLHWDHVQGLPFFPPLVRGDAVLSIYAPVLEDGRTVEDVVAAALRPPLFPVGIDAFPGTVEFHSMDEGELRLGEIEITARLIPHIGHTFGFRLAWGGASVAYVSDHQQPSGSTFETTDSVMELCRGVDLLIHDAQFTTEEFSHKSDWGHCTVDYAVWVAREAGARTLALYHHDPLHDDDQLDALVAAADASVDEVQVIGAREGLTLHLGS